MPTLRRIQGLRFNIIGLGRIGTATAIRAKTFGFDVGFFDPYKPDGWEKATGLRRFFDLHDLLEVSDVISLHTPLTAETTNLVNRDFIASTSHGAILINTARGAIMNLAAVWDGLQGGRLGGVGLDVLPTEPPDLDEPLLQAWQRPDDYLVGKIILTPHCAFFNQESYIEMRTKAAKTAFEFLERGTLKNCVNT